MAKNRLKIPADFRRSSAFKTTKMNLGSSVYNRNGEFVDKKMTPKRASITAGCEILASQGCLELTPDPQTTQRKSHDLLHALGYTVEVSEENFSLVDSVQEQVEMADYLTDLKPAQLVTHPMVTTSGLAQNFTDPYNAIYQPDDHVESQFRKKTGYTNQSVNEVLDLVNTANSFTAMGVKHMPLQQTSRYWQDGRVALATTRGKRQS